MRRRWPDHGLAAVGHRVVHGGAVYAQPYPITTELLAALRHVVPLAPNHLPSALAAIQAIAHAYPGVPQVASFDTAFHRTMPRLAQLDALPRALAEAGIIRYGFPSLSYESILWRLRAVAGAAAADGRVIIAHRSAPICNRTRT